MGDRRKLNSEIDRCLKKVNEGVETFEDIWHRVQTAPNQNQKDRHEQDLKKEIKKLQRLRDQIKTWLSSPDIKDKTPLQESRKNIEQQMERFKAVEREAKTKAYSNGGLAQRLDPQEKEKENCMEWIQESIRELEIQRDRFESDIELLSATTKKKKAEREKQERLDELKRWLAKHNFHITSLQKILRAIDNEAVDLKEVNELRTDIDYYVRSNQEPDFKENDMMYEGIDMDNLNSIMGPGVTTPSQTHPTSTFNGGTHGSSIILSTATDVTGLNSQSYSSNPHIHERITSISLTTNTQSVDNDLHSTLIATATLTAATTTITSLTQPSSPSSSPTLPMVEESKKNKNESSEYSTHRHRSNSGVNGSASSTISHLTSPKPSSTNQQSPGVQTTTKNPLNLTSSTSNLNASPNLAHSLSSPAPNTTNATATNQTVLPYAAIVSQSTPSSSSGSLGNPNTKNQSNAFSPTQKQVIRQLSINTNDPTVINNQNVPVSASSSSSLLTTHVERNGGSHSQSNSSLTSVTMNNGQTVIMPINSSNIPHELPPNNNNNNIDSPIGTQKPQVISRNLSEIERNNNQSGSLVSGLPTNGTSEGHGPLDHSNFSNTQPPSASILNSQPINTMSSTFLSPLNQIDVQQQNNGNLIGTMTDHHPLRYPNTSLNNQTSVLNNRVPLSSVEARTLNRINSAFNKLPSLLESERQRANANRICGRNPINHSQIVPYYPQTPPASSDTPEFYYRLTPETLFFVFYYMEGTRAQFLAAKALKRQSWRFHTKHMMWFQRHEEPKTITDDYEQGIYIYFDYERWQTRKSENFTFEYKYLEDREC